MSRHMTERPRWKAYLFGGNYYEQKENEYGMTVTYSGWSPNIIRHMIRYLRQRWWEAGYSPLDWALHRDKTIPDHDMLLTPQTQNETNPSNE